MAAFARLGELVARSADDDLAAMLQEKLKKLLEVKQSRLAVDQRDHVHAEAILQLRQLEQVVEDDVRDFAAFELDDHAHAGLVRLVAQIRNAFELFVAHQLANAGEQRRFVDLVGYLVDDDRLSPAFVQLLDMRARANHDAAATGAVALAHAFRAVNNSCRGEVRCRDVLDQIVDGNVPVFEQGKTGGHHFGEIMRRDVGRHPHRNARRAVDQQIRNARRQNRRLHLLAVVVRREIDRFLVDVGQHFGGDFLQTALGVSIRCRRVAIDGAEVALAIDQGVTQGEVLHHAHQRLVRRAVTMRVIFAKHVANHACAFHVRAVPHVIGLVHGEQHAAMNGFQAVTNIGQRPAHDHAHRVIEIGMAHFGFQADWKSLFGELLHRWQGPLRLTADNGNGVSRMADRFAARLLPLIGHVCGKL